MEGRCLWVKADDVEGLIEEGHVVKATRPLNDWCLRGDDDGEPVEAGTLLEIVEVRAWGAAMAQELPDVQPLDVSPAAIMEAALELAGMGLFEIVTGPEMAPDGDIETVERAVKAVR